MTLSDDDKRILNALWSDAGSAGGYSSERRLYDAAKRRISLSKIREFLAAKKNYSLLTERKRWKRNKGRIYHAIPESCVQFALDTWFLPRLTPKSPRYCILAICCFSRFTFAYVSRKLNSQVTTAALQRVIAACGRKPSSVFIDRGNFSVFMQRNNKQIRYGIWKIL